MRANIPCHKCLPLILWATSLSEFSFFPDGTLKSHLWMKVYVVSQFKRTEDWPGDVIVFLWMPILQDQPKVCSPKKVPPPGFYFWQVTLLLVEQNTCVCFFVHMCLFLFTGTTVSSALGAFHGGKLLLLTTFVITELERQEKMTSTARDIIVPII